MYLICFIFMYFNKFLYIIPWLKFLYNIPWLKRAKCLGVYKNLYSLYDVRNSKSYLIMSNYYITFFFLITNMQSPWYALAIYFWYSLFTTRCASFVGCSFGLIIANWLLVVVNVCRCCCCFRNQYISFNVLLISYGLKCGTFLVVVFPLWSHPEILGLFCCDKKISKGCTAKICRKFIISFLSYQYTVTNHNVAIFCASSSVASVLLVILLL